MTLQHEPINAEIYLSAVRACSNKPSLRASTTLSEARNSHNCRHQRGLNLVVPPKALPQTAFSFTTSITKSC